MNSITGNVFDIQGFSLHDGPGCRTTVFLSGCPLECQWCANPEGWKKNQLTYLKTMCKGSKGCRACLESCEKGAISFSGEGELILKREICRDCSDLSCTFSCYNGALKKPGREISSEELLKIILRDSFYWGDSGGVTFSGGEPLNQKDFILEMLEQCRKNYIHTAVETTAFAETSYFLEAMKMVDFAFIDIKHFDSEKHQEKTGKPNGIILKNIKELSASSKKPRVVIRIPVIEGFNDDPGNISDTADFLLKTGLYEVNLLPFHNLGESKWTQLGKDYLYKNKKNLKEDILDEIQKVFLKKGIKCYNAEKTPF